MKASIMLLALVLLTGFFPAAHAVTSSNAVVSAKDVLDGRLDNAPVRLRGVVRNAFDDEIDPRFIYFILLSDGESLYAAVSRKNLPSDILGRIIGAEVEVSGICQPRLHGTRQHIGRHIHVNSTDGIRILRPPSENLFDVPDAAALRTRHPGELPKAGRHLTHGRVVAVWNGTELLLRTDDDLGYSFATLSAPPAPRWNEVVDVSGFPSTDLFSLRFSCAAWRASDAPAPEASPVYEIPAENLFRDEDGRARFRYAMNGRTVRLHGIVHRVPASPDERLTLDCDGRLMSVDRGTLDAPFRDLAPGSAVDVTATCVMETDNWTANTTFPRVRGFFLVLRTPADLHVVARPSRLTPARLLAALAVLAILLVAVLVWNVLLRRLAHRRAQDLVLAQLAASEAELKARERTRLAVELHDTLAQNLTGVSMEIESAARCADANPSELRRHLTLADKTLKSCRAELRNELWDLRNQALEEPDLAAAIRQTLLPHIRDITLEVSVDVPRKRLTDRQAHDLLRVLRELALNGIRHGKATRIVIRSEARNGATVFSVTDNGCGFDPDAAPGVTAGHFGLQGVRERLRSLRGDLRIESQPGTGTCATVTIAPPPPSAREERT